MGFVGKRFSQLFGSALVVLEIFYFTSVAQTRHPQSASGKSPAINGLSDRKLDRLRKLGSVYLQKKEWQSASAIFDEALAIQPDDPQSLYGKALALFNLQQISGANEKLDQVIRILSQSGDRSRLLVDSLVLSAVISAVHNKNSMAIQKLETAVKLIPTDFDANFSLGRAYFGNGDVSAAVSSFRQAVAILPSHVQARFFLATALEREGDYKDALSEYREILRLSPNNADGNLGLGVLLLKIEGDDSPEGIAALQKAVLINGRLYEGQITLGRTLLRLNKAEEAVGHLQKAADIAPNNPEPHFQLALAYRKLGNRDKADAETEIVKKIHESRRGVSNQTPQ